MSVLRQPCTHTTSTPLSAHPSEGTCASAPSTPESILESDVCKLLCWVAMCRPITAHLHMMAELLARKNTMSRQELDPLVYQVLRQPRNENHDVPVAMHEDFVTVARFSQQAVHARLGSPLDCDGKNLQLSQPKKIQ